MPQTYLKERLLFGLALCALCLLVYLPGLGGGFLFDDFPNIVSNRKVHAETLDWESLKQAAAAYGPGIYGRPLATLGFAVDFFIGGKDALAFKVHSLLVHAINTLLVFALSLRLLGCGATVAKGTHWAAFFLAAIWAIHPLQVSTVLYVVQRMEMLSTTFVLLALLAYLKGRDRQVAGARGGIWLATSAALAGLGMLAKETAILFPLYALCLELTLLSFAAADDRTRGRLKQVYVSAALAGMLLFLFVVVPHYLAPEAYQNRSFTVSERLLTQLRVLPMYLGQMLLPSPGSLLFYYDHLAPSRSLVEPISTLMGGFLLAGLLLITWATRRKMPLLSLGLLWFFAAHSLTSNVIPLELAFEHRNYFALLGILLAGAALLQAFARRVGLSRPKLALAALVVGLASLGAIRSATWGNPLLLASDLVNKNPQSPRASSDLATLFASMADNSAGSPFFLMAMSEFERGSLLPTSSPLPEQGLIIMAAVSGAPTNAAWWDRIDRKLRNNPVGPQESMAITGLVTQRAQGLPIDDARLSQAYEILLIRKPGNASLHSLYAQYQLKVMRNQKLAARHFAMSIWSENAGPEYRERILQGLASDGQLEAREELLRILASSADNPGLAHLSAPSDD